MFDNTHTHTLLLFKQKFRKNEFGLKVTSEVAHEANSTWPDDLEYPVLFKQEQLLMSLLLIISQVDICDFINLFRVKAQSIHFQIKKGRGVKGVENEERVQALMASECTATTDGRTYARISSRLLTNLLEIIQVCRMALVTDTISTIKRNASFNNESILVEKYFIFLR